jgi:hypothetical protein
MDDLFGKLDGTPPSPEPGAASTEGTTGSAEPPVPEKSGEDLSKMQSERDKEVARANKLQKELDALKAASAKDAGASEVPPQVQEWIVAAKLRTRESLYDANPKFKAYGIDPTFITGDTPVAMQASAQSLTAFVDTLEGSVRDQVLRDHGFNPEPLASTRAAGKSFQSMSSEEFNRIVDEALRG